MALYSWWQREDHKSFNVMQDQPGEAAALSRPTILRRMAALLPGIGWTKSEAVAKKFPAVNTSNYQTKDYATVEALQADLDNMLNSGWKLVCFGFSGASAASVVVAVYIKVVPVALKGSGRSEAWKFICRYRG